MHSAQFNLFETIVGMGRVQFWVKIELRHLWTVPTLLKS